MNRIDKRFKILKQKDEKALITFISAGVPSLNTTKDLIIEMEERGVDIVEIGIPNSRPIADGPVISEASRYALENGAKISKIMSMVEELRKDTEIPLVYLVYFNSVFAYGIDRFIARCSEIGIDGILIPDLPIEERGEVLGACKDSGVYLVPLVTPSSHGRIEEITKDANGFVYCVAVKGVTGIRSSVNEDIAEYMDSVSKYTKLPKAIGFGVSTPEMAKSYKDFAEGVIVGSAIVKRTLEEKSDQEIVKDVGDFVYKLKQALI